MFKPMHLFTDLFVGVQSTSLNQYAPHNTSNVHDKFQSCTVGVKGATMIYNSHSADLGVCVDAQCMPLHST